MKSLSPERFARLDQLLEQALECSAAERAKLLAELRDRDPTDAADLERLIEQSQRADSLLDAQPWARLEPKLAAQHEPGDQLGRYRLQRLLGRGGMGEVWLAHNDAGVAVALKLIRSELSRAVLADRLRRERDILMRLNDPAIARLLDSGLSESGEPYLALEYVEGEPLLHAADRARLDLRGRVRWMQAIAAAVAAAQAQLVIHRDIKPANILIDRQGQPKLLDFGIAKLLDASGLGHSTELTEASGRAMTPGYAAPEQWRGEPVTTATDVYALGVVLHELLLGQRPERVGEGWVAASQLARRAVDPTVRERRRELRGDLDAVLARALAVEPKQRYSNAQALADELEAFLVGRPVRAREGLWWDRLGKLIARHRVASAAIGLGLLAASAGAYSAWQQSLAAHREAARAAYVQRFLEDLFGNDLPGAPRDELPSTAELLARGIEQALADQSAEPGARLSLLLSLARIQQGQRDWAGASISFAGARALLPEVPDAPTWQDAAIAAEEALSQSQLQPGPQTIEALEAAINRAQAAGAPQAWQIRKALDLISAQVDLDRDEAARDQAARLLQQIEVVPVPVATRLTVLTEAVVAYSFDQIYRPEAETYARQALALAAAEFGENHAETAYAAMRVAGVLRIKGDIAAALAEVQRATAVARRVYPPQHPQLARILEEHARILGRHAPDADVIPLWREVVAIRTKAYGADSYAVARTRVFLANRLNRQAQYTEAAEQAMAAATVLRREVGTSHPFYLDVLSYAATALTQLNRRADALALLPSVEAELPADLPETNRWRFLGLIEARLHLEPDPNAIALFVQRLADERATPRPVAHLCLSTAALALEHGLTGIALRALDAAEARIAADDPTQLGEVARLLRLLASTPRDVDAIRAARVVVAARRGQTYFAVRLADRVLARAGST